jgi:hypothetical protein
MLEQLESRQFFAATTVTFNPVDGSATTGRFTSKVLANSTGGDKLDLKFYLQNKLGARQVGTMDLSYVLDPVVKDQPPRATKFDPLLKQLKNVAVSLPPKGTQVFSASVVIPDGLPDGLYWVAVSLDAGGAIDKNQAFNGGVLGAFATSYAANYVDIFTQKFTLSAKKLPVGVSGTIRETLRNVGNATPTGQVLVKVFASTSKSASNSDVLITQQQLDVSTLKPFSSKTYTIAFDSPSNLAPGSYYVRIFLDRSAVGKPSNENTTANTFTSKPIKLR